MAAILNSAAYQRLSQNPEIVEVAAPDPREIPEMPAVPMDHFLITTQKIAGTMDVVTCFAVCCQGSRKDGETILGLAHSSIYPIQFVQGVLIGGMLNKGCEESTIKTYVVGGLLPTKEEPTSCLDQEREVIEQAERSSIVGARFNVVKSQDEGLSVLFTPNLIRISKVDLFRQTGTIGIDLQIPARLEELRRAKSMAAHLERSNPYKRLSHCPEIVEVDSPDPEEIGDRPDVDMDSYAITAEGMLCTSGVHTCFAVCCQGRKAANGETLLAMAHASDQPLLEVYRILSEALIKSGCDQMTLKTYVIGGMVVCEDGLSSCLDEEQSLLRQADQCHLVGARFNVVKGADESLSVVFTPDHVRFSTGDLFKSAEEIGEPLE
jgi:hypothetical protein